MIHKIIIVGMDNTGKTTLVKNLLNFFNTQSIIPFSKVKSLGPEIFIEEGINYLTDKLKDNNNYIFERFFPIEELVYGEILRGKSRFNIDSSFIKWVFEENDIILIYCRPTIKTIKNWKNREQMGGVIRRADELIKRFDEVIKLIRNKYKPLFFKYNYKKDNLNTFMLKISMQGVIK